MDDFRVGSLSPSDPIQDRQGEDLRKRNRKARSGPEGCEIEDVVSFSEQLAEEEDGGAGYSPPPAEERRG